MMDKMNRRAFLKSAGTVALAVAAAGVLTACGEDAPAPAPTPTYKPTPIQPTKPEENETGLEISDIISTTSYMEAAETTKYYALFRFTVKNTSNASISLTKENFTVKMDGGAEQKTDYMFDQVENGLKGLRDPKELKAGESAAIAVDVVIDKATRDSWNSKSRKIELIAHNDGKTASFTFQTK